MSNKFLRFFITLIVSIGLAAAQMPQQAYAESPKTIPTMGDTITALNIAHEHRNTFAMPGSFPQTGMENSSLQLIPPANDDFANATAINSLPFSDSLDNTLATMELNEPGECGYAPRTVWYSFTPTVNGAVKADMAGSSFFDTIISVFQSNGPGFENPNPLICASYSNSLTFSAQVGITYYIMASSMDSNGGDLHVNLQMVLPPANDNFADASLVSSLPFDDTVNDTSGATIETGEPTPSCVNTLPYPNNTV